MGDTVLGPDGTPFPRRNPNRWEEAQWAFRRRYAADPGSLPRMPVVFRWWTVEETVWGFGPPGAVVWLIRYARRKRRHGPDGRFIALYPPDAPAGSAPFLCFEFFGDPPGPGSSGEGTGVLVGEPVTSGTLLLETVGRVVLPLWNPQSQKRHVPTR